MSAGEVPDCDPGPKTLLGVRLESVKKISRQADWDWDFADCKIWSSIPVGSNKVSCALAPERATARFHQHSHGRDRDSHNIVGGESSLLQCTKIHHGKNDRASRRCKLKSLRVV